ncbi:STAS domain-containing protein [Thermopolyspora sp. NPDC052614]|uniref:STAS domain-containing protein n=1 Tax=Thermopolyspora sp. NPDC052614 TaxID=3155682 RepID=UPI00342A94A4
MPDQTSLSIEVRRPAPETTRLVLSGDLGFTTRQEPARAAADLLAGDGHRLEMDLAGLDFFDSSGLGALVNLYGKAKERGMTVTVVAVTPHMRSVLRRTGLEAMLNLPPCAEPG